MATLREQIRSNSVALISLSVALIALSYNTWRNETTESQEEYPASGKPLTDSVNTVPNCRRDTCTSPRDTP